MEVRAWRSGKFSNPDTAYGIWVGRQNRTDHFTEHLESITVDIDGVEHSFRLTSSFWRRCIAVREAGQTAIRDWLERHYTTDWPHGQPPRFVLQPLGAGRFKLSKLQREAPQKYSQFAGVCKEGTAGPYG